MPDSFDNAFEGEVSGQTNARQTSLGLVLAALKNDDQLKGAFCLNLFTHDVEHSQDNILLTPYSKKGTPVTDLDASCIRTYLTNKYHLPVSKVNLDDAIIAAAMDFKYHPIIDYFEKLRWDGIPRLDKWLVEIVGAEDSPYTRAVSRKMMVAAVKRVYEPGCYYAQLVILEGRQRIFKSRLVKEIGGDLYASIHLKTQDTKTIVEEMRGMWILEIEELAGFSKQETEYMKAFLSRQSDRVRVAFGRRADNFPRQSIMIATMNPDVGENKYLVDQTGNVRYWPIKCGEIGKIKIDDFKSLRDQLFAEAVVLYRQGETLWLDSESEEILAEEEQEKRLSTDPWSNIITKHLANRALEAVPPEVTTVSIARDVLAIPAERINSGVTRRVGRALAQAGWIRHRKAHPPREWYYMPPKIEPKAWDE